MPWTLKVSVAFLAAILLSLGTNVHWPEALSRSVQWGFAQGPSRGIWVSCQQLGARTHADARW